MMAAVLSPASSSPSGSPQISSSNPNHPPLAPLITSPQPRQRTQLQRPLSHASKHRLSQYSTNSGPSRSRPPSHVFPVFHSSLPYATVRDFAYPTVHALHYGPPPESSQPPSGISTPISESQHRLSDPPTSWDSRGSWAPGPWGGDGAMKGEQLAPVHYGDGPPWSEDEDLASPVVVSSRHKKHKLSQASLGGGRGRGSREITHPSNNNLLSPDNFEADRGFFAASNLDGSERYYVDQGGEANGPGGEFVTYPASQARHTSNTLSAPYNTAGQRDSHFAGTLLPSRSYTDTEGNTQNYHANSDSDSSRGSSPGGDFIPHDESRYSRDYQFTIASPDEEMHGKAVALFDFARENENELPLVEGQVIWVSYRQSQGWLVAEDPKTQESGLVPEEYVRLLRDIQGGLHSLTGQTDGMFSPGGNSIADAGTPTQAEHEKSFGAGSRSEFGNAAGQGAGASSTMSPSATSNGNSGSGYQQPVVSTFSTSSKDLRPYPHTLLLGGQAGVQPPQVVHYQGGRGGGGGSQANTPTVASVAEGRLGAAGGVEKGHGGSAMDEDDSSEEEQEEKDDEDDDSEEEEKEEEEKKKKKKEEVKPPPPSTRVSKTKKKKRSS